MNREVNEGKPYKFRELGKGRLEKKGGKANAGRKTAPALTFIAACRL